MYIYKVSANAYFITLQQSTEWRKWRLLLSMSHEVHQTCKFIILCCNMKTVHHRLGFRLTHTNVHYNRNEPLLTILTLQNGKCFSCCSASHTPVDRIAPWKCCFYFCFWCSNLQTHMVTWELYIHQCWRVFWCYNTC